MVSLIKVHRCSPDEAMLPQATPVKYWEEQENQSQAICDGCGTLTVFFSRTLADTVSALRHNLYFCLHSPPSPSLFLQVSDFLFLFRVRKIPWRMKWQPTPLFFPRESHGQRSLMGYSPPGHKESDMT